MYGPFQPLRLGVQIPYLCEIGHKYFLIGLVCVLLVFTSWFSLYWVFIWALISLSIFTEQSWPFGPDKGHHFIIQSELMEANIRGDVGKSHLSLGMLELAFQPVLPRLTVPLWPMPTNWNVIYKGLLLVPGRWCGTAYRMWYTKVCYWFLGDDVTLPTECDVRRSGIGPWEVMSHRLYKDLFE